MNSTGIRFTARLLPWFALVLFAGACAKSSEAAADEDDDSMTTETEMDADTDDTDGTDTAEVIVRAVEEEPEELPSLIAGAGRHANAKWDWSGIVGTGQSLAVGTTPINARVNDTPYGNLMLSLGELVVPPFDPTAAELSIAPLVEPLRRLKTGYPSPYPGNLYGETPHGAMASQISWLAHEESGADYVSVHTVVGESGQGMVALVKDPVSDSPNIGRAYAATSFEVEAITRLASEAGKTYGVSAIVLTHGETDAGSPSYEAQLVKLWSDYNADLKAITGQTEDIPMIVSQQHAYGFQEGVPSGTSASTVAQWKVGVNNPGSIICAGPKYQYLYHTDNIHLQTLGYEMLGEKYGQVYTQHVVLGQPWQPLQPLDVEHEGRIVRIRFHVPVPPLNWDEELPPSAIPEWRAGRGFELRQGSLRLEIEGVEIVSDDTVEITTATEVPPGSWLGYAVTSDGTSRRTLGHRWGQLRDSDPFVGAITGRPQPNYSVAFELRVP